MFSRLLRLEAAKSFRPALTWLGLLVLAALMGLLFAVFFAFRGQVPASGTRFLYWPDSFVYALGDAAGFSPLTSYGTCLLIVLVGLGTAREYGWRTVQLWLAHGASRRALLAAKLAVGLATAALIVLLCLVTIGGLSAAFSVADHGTVGAGRLDAGQLGLASLRTLLAMLPYGAAALLVAVLTRSAVAAVGGVLAFLAIVETSLSGVLPRLGGEFARAVWYLPSGLGAALNSGDGALAHAAPAHAAYEPDPVVAAICLAAYTLVLCGLALLAFQRQDLTA
jgi:ABC-type transport system involved in multi-copper enzyme maturation permease subunit